MMVTVVMIVMAVTVVMIVMVVTVVMIVMVVSVVMVVMLVICRTMRASTQLVPTGNLTRHSFPQRSSEEIIQISMI